jgi:Family of unknown function (DUF695)
LLGHGMAKWLTAEKLREGFPLLLRRPATLDVASLRPRFPMLAFVTHTFTKVTSNGLPEGDYNHGIAELDHELLTAFDTEAIGVVVLVETYGGERCYYFYVMANADVAGVISAVGRRYPHERLSYSMRPDPSWQFIEGYARDHF